MLKQQIQRILSVGSQFDLSLCNKWIVREADKYLKAMFYFQNQQSSAAIRHTFFCNELATETLTKLQEAYQKYCLSKE